MAGEDDIPVPVPAKPSRTAAAIRRTLPVLDDAAIARVEAAADAAARAAGRLDLVLGGEEEGFRAVLLMADHDRIRPDDRDSPWSQGLLVADASGRAAFFKTQEAGAQATASRCC